MRKGGVGVRAGGWWSYMGKILGDTSEWLYRKPSKHYSKMIQKKKKKLKQKTDMLYTS
jgi:hypothetical protein